MKKSWIAKLIGIPIVAVTIVYVIAWIVFIKGGSYPTGAGLSKSDWLGFYGSIITLFGTLFLGIIAYMQNISLQKANERFEKANLNMLEQDLKLNGFSSISIELITIYNDGINLFFKNTGKFYPSTMSVNSAVIESENESKNKLTVLAESQGVFHAVKHYDGYFFLPLSEGDIKMIRESLINDNCSDISPQENLVLWLDYELENSLGVITKVYEKLIAKKIAVDGFVIEYRFLINREIFIQNAEN